MQAGRDEVVLSPVDTVMGTCKAHIISNNMCGENLSYIEVLVDNIDTLLCTLHWNSNGIGS